MERDRIDHQQFSRPRRKGFAEGLGPAEATWGVRGNGGRAYALQALRLLPYFRSAFPRGQGMAAIRFGPQLLSLLRIGGGPYGHGPGAAIRCHYQMVEHAYLVHTRFFRALGGLP